MKTDGNVLYPEFSSAKPSTDLTICLSCEPLYIDEHVALTRIAIQCAGDTYIQHLVLDLPHDQ